MDSAGASRKVFQDSLNPTVKFEVQRTSSRRSDPREPYKYASNRLPPFMVLQQSGHAECDPCTCQAHQLNVHDCTNVIIFDVIS
jgi:hypothetical protein